MSDFLLIVPEGWIEIAPDVWPQYTTVQDILGSIEDGSFRTLDMQFVDTEVLPEGYRFVALQFFQDGLVNRLWARIEPI